MVQTGGCLSGKELCRKVSGGPNEQEVKLEPPMSPSSIPCCFRKNVTSRSREIIFPFLALGKPQLECWAQSWAPRYKRNKDIMEQVQQKARKTMKGLESVSYMERLQESWDF